MSKRDTIEITTPNTRQERQEQRGKLKRSRRIGYTLVTIQLILTIVFGTLLVMLGVLTTGYLISAIGILAFFVVYNFGTQFSRKMRLAGKIWSVILSIVLAFGSFYIFKTYDVLSAITGGDTKTDVISVVVLKNNPAKTIDDVKGETFGIVGKVGRSTTDKAIENIKKDTDSAVKTKESEDFTALAKALYKEKSTVILFNEAYRGTVKENYKDFDKETKVIKEYKYTTKLAGSGSNVKVTKEPFIVYLNGNDESGEVRNTGRSDANICAVVNPKTDQILLVTTPRDYLVELKGPDFPEGTMDKLTHASIYGIDTAMKTLGNLYDEKLDYYVRVNFTGFAEIVDALGGIEVDSEFDFTAIDGDHYTKGINKLDGKRALNYARERKSFPLGDMQRNKHQTQVLKAIIGKMVSPSVLASYGDVMDGVKGAFLTDFTSKEISDLVKMQLNNKTNWEILSYNVMGKTGKEYVYSLTKLADVVYQDAAQVQNAKNLIDKVLGGKTITQEEIDSLSDTTAK